jgi:hypothetical protein
VETVDECGTNAASGACHHDMLPAEFHGLNRRCCACGGSGSRTGEKSRYHAIRACCARDTFATRLLVKETTVTETTEKPTSGTETTEFVIHEALTVIDKALSQMMSRELVSSGEITDVLLDVRMLLTAPVAVSAGN